MSGQEDTGLSVQVVGGRLVISIGINTLGHSATLSDDILDTFGQPKITDARVFAEAVAEEMEHEDDVGHSGLTRLLDQCTFAAIESGCEGVLLPEDTPESGK